MLIILIAVGVFVYQKNKTPIESCRLIDDNSQKIVCWKKVIDKDLSYGDLNRTMEIVSQGYSQDSDFAKNCHDFMHSVGKTAYEMYSNGKNFKVGDKTSYCAYGFYHGFMESLVSRSGDLALAQSFCKKVNDELSKSAPGANLACYHGIGHGWTNVHDPKFFGNERAMVAPAIGLCEKVTSDPEELKICVTGVFDSISISYYNESDGLKMNKQDPYWLCKEQEDKYKTPCYMDLSPAVLWLGDQRLDKSLKYLNTVEVGYRDIVAQTLAEDSVRFIIRDSLNIDMQVGFCRKLGSKYNLTCIYGLAMGYMQFGAPGKEEESGVGFCNLQILSNQEKDYCYSKILPIIKSSFSQEKYSKLCMDNPQDLNKYCTN